MGEGTGGSLLFHVDFEQSQPRQFPRTEREVQVIAKVRQAVVVREAVARVFVTGDLLDVRHAQIPRLIENRRELVAFCLVHFALLMHPTS